MGIYNLLISLQFLVILGLGTYILKEKLAKRPKKLLRPQPAPLSRSTFIDRDRLYSLSPRIDVSNDVAYSRALAEATARPVRAFDSSVIRLDKEPVVDQSFMSRWRSMLGKSQKPDEKRPLPAPLMVRSAVSTKIDVSDPTSYKTAIATANHQEVYKGKVIPQKRAEV